MAVVYWSEHLNRDVSLEEEARMEDLMELEYAKFAESVMGDRPAAPNFYDNY
jgi:hypothetical protein